MTLSELKQLKTDLSSGVIVSKATWLKVLDTAIANYPQKKLIHDDGARQATPTYRPSVTVEL